MIILSTAEKKTQIASILGSVTRQNLESAFNSNLTEVIKQMISLPEGESVEFSAVMDLAVPRIGAAMTELFSEEFISALISPTLDQYNDDQVDHVFGLVTNPMYARFMSDVTMGMVKSPVYMTGIMKIGPQVEQILQSVWEELHPKNTEEEPAPTIDALLPA